MYIKLVGAAAAIAACLMAGNSYYTAKRAYCRCLEGLCLLLRLVSSELGSSAADLKCVFESTVPRLEGSVSAFACAVCESLDRLGEQSFETLWSDCALRFLPSLGVEERNIINEAGAVLGRYELSLQLQALDSCRERLFCLHEKALAELPAQRRLSMGLPAAFGIMLVIVLI